MKNWKVVNKTTNSKEYKRLKGAIVSGCPICAPHKGCNRWHRNKPHKSWKSWRKTQWKGVKDYLRLGRKGEWKRIGSYWERGYVRPATKFWKRNANKRVRKSNNTPNGGSYKKYWGWHKWC